MVSALSFFIAFVASAFLIIHALEFGSMTLAKNHKLLTINHKLSCSLPHF
jgi:hypothetical protein